MKHWTHEGGSTMQRVRALRARHVRTRRSAPSRPSPARLPRCPGLLAAVAVALWLALRVTPVVAGPQPYTSSGGDVGLEYVLAALERILPDTWTIAEHGEDAVPYRWNGPGDALEVKLEDGSLEIQHPAGFEYHPFIRLYFCPGEWVGGMQETDYYGDQEPALLLGKNHIFRVFYQPRGPIRWSDIYEQLAITFDLTRPPVDRGLRLIVDTGLRSRLQQRISSVVHDMRRDVLDRLAGLERHGNLLYVEYVATVTNPPAAPGAPPLIGPIRKMIEEETEGLAGHLFQILPDVRTIYVRRLCDNRLFDRVLDRDATGALSSMTVGGL